MKNTSKTTITKNTFIFFDLDGTVIDSTDAIIDSFSKVFDYFNITNFDAKKTTDLIGYPLTYMFKELGIPDKDIDESVEIYKKEYAKVKFAQTFLIDGAIEALEEAYQFATLGVVTTKIAKFTTPLLEHLGILKYFDSVIGFESVKKPKPDKESVLKCIQELNADKKNSWMIGDTFMDTLSAKNADIRSVGVLTGYGDKDEMSKYATFVQNDVRLAVNLIKQIDKEI